MYIYIRNIYIRNIVIVTINHAETERCPKREERKKIDHNEKRTEIEKNERTVSPTIASVSRSL